MLKWLLKQWHFLLENIGAKNRLGSFNELRKDVIFCWQEAEAHFPNHFQSMHLST